MPILAQEIDLYPEDLLSAKDEIEPDQSWWTLYTLSRREKQLMRYLLSLEIPFYAPIVAKRSRSPSGRIRTSYVPLFPGYIFMFGGADQRYQALTTNCISRCLEVSNGAELQHDLWQINQLIDSGAPLTVESRIEPGEFVRIRNGRFAGLEGTVLKRHSKTRLVVTVNFIQQGASVLLDDCQVDPA